MPKNDIDRGAARRQTGGEALVGMFALALAVAGLTFDGLRGLLTLLLALAITLALIVGSTIVGQRSELSVVRRIRSAPWIVIPFVTVLGLIGYAAWSSGAHSPLPVYRGHLNGTYEEGARLWHWFESHEGDIVYLNVTFFARAPQWDDEPAAGISIREPYDAPSRSSLAFEHGGSVDIECDPSDVISGDCIHLGIVVGRTPPGREHHLFYAHGEYYLIGHFAVGAPSTEHMGSRQVHLRPVDAEAVRP